MQSRLSPIAIVVLVVYGIGFPGAIFLAFYLLRNRIKEDQWLRVHGSGDSYARNENLTLRKSCGQMYRMYQPRFYLWSTLIWSKATCAIAVMFRDNQLIKCLVPELDVYRIHNAGKNETIS